MQTRMVRGILAAALLAAGCGQPAADSGATKSASNDAAATVETDVQSPAPEQPRETVPEQTGPTPAAASSAGSEITLVELPWEGVLEQIAAQQGKVVVVDLWATYCDPCRASFPGLVALSQQDPENIVCLSVSLDDPSDAERRAMALAFLQEQQAKFTNILCTTDETQLYDEILKIGGIPAVYVYGRDGQMAKLFTGRSPDGGEHTYEAHITPYVTQLAAGADSGQ